MAYQNITIVESKIPEKALEKASLAMHHSRKPESKTSTGYDNSPTLETTQTNY